jgi:hypothetical protein
MCPYSKGFLLHLNPFLEKADGSKPWIANQRRISRNMIKVRIFMQESALIIHRQHSDEYIDDRTRNPLSSKLKNQFG